METIKFMFFWHNYSYKINSLKRILVDVGNTSHLFCNASELIESDNLHLFLLSVGTRVHDDKYLKHQERSTDLTTCTEEQMSKIFVFLTIKKLLFKNFFFSVNINYFYDKAAKQLFSGWQLLKNYYIHWT